MKVMTLVILLSHMLYLVICYYTLLDHNNHYRFVHVQCPASLWYLLTATCTVQVGPTPQSCAWMNTSN